MVPANPLVLSKMITPKRFRDPAYAAGIAASIYGGRMRDEPGLASVLLNGHAPLTSWRGYALQLVAGLGWTSLPFLPLIRQQTLVLAGEDDPIIPSANATIMTRLLPHAVLYTYPDGHLGLITRPDELAARIADFLRAGDKADDDGAVTAPG